MVKQVKTMLVTSALLLVASQSAFAAPNVSSVSVQDVGYAGNGCPGGSAAVVIAPDRQSVSVLFDEYIAEAGAEGQGTFDRKKCDVAFSLKIPSGVSVSLVDADYRGFTDLPAGAQGTFTRDYFFAGSQGPSLSSRWNGSRSSDFLIEDRLGVLATVWSPCGADVILRSKTAATVRTQRGRSAMVMVDSIDMRAKTVFRYNLAYRECR